MCLCLCGFGQQLTGELVEIFVDFLQSVNFIFKFSNSHFCVFTIAKDRLKDDKRQLKHGFSHVLRASAWLTLSVTAFIREFSRSAFSRYDSSSCYHQRPCLISTNQHFSSELDSSFSPVCRDPVAHTPPPARCHHPPRC